jgi:hypothetical protein
MTNLTIILIVLLILIRFLIGLRLFASAQRNSLPNLRTLAFQLISISFALLFSPLPNSPLGSLPISLPIFIGGTLISQALLIVFNQETFYKDKQSSAVRWSWAIFALTGLMTIYGVAVSESAFNQSPWVAAYILSQIVIWAWHGQIAYQARAGLKNQPAVEDWVKTRYLLIVAYAIIFILGALGSAVRILLAGGTVITTLGNVAAIVTLLAQIIGVSLQFLVWVMPEGFRLWLNRNYKARLDEYSQSQTRAILNILGNALARDTGLTEIGAMWALRQIIAKRIGTEEPEAVVKQINQLTYQDWETTLKNPELAKLLASQGLSTTKLHQALENAGKALIEKQSLFTIEAR